MHKTVFVIGAGASKEVGLPIGNALKGQIAKLLDIRYENGFRRPSGDDTIDDAIRAAIAPESRDISPHLHAAWRIRDSMELAPSIDNFLHVHAGDKKLELCGKLAIVRAILMAERSSSLRDPTPGEGQQLLYFRKFSDTWYNKFFKCFLGSKNLNEIREVLNSISFIVFNYDRCIEQYLFFTLQQYYSISEKDAAEILNGLKIYHPYGTCGKLRWQSPNDFTPFGASVNGHKLLELSAKIRTFTEGTDMQDSEILAVRRKLTECDSTVFLGFGFHDLNMKLLRTDQPDTSDGVRTKKVYGTSLGFSPSDTEILGRELEGFFRPHIVSPKLTNKTCTDFFDEHWKALSQPYN